MLIVLGIISYIIGHYYDRNIEQYKYTSGLISEIYEVPVNNDDVRKRPVVRYRVGEKVYEWEMDEFYEKAYKEGETAQVYYNIEESSDVMNTTRYELLAKRGGMLQFFGWILIGSGVLLHLLQIAGAKREKDVAY